MKVDTLFLISFEVGSKDLWNHIKSHSVWIYDHQISYIYVRSSSLSPQQFALTVQYLTWDRVGLKKSSVSHKSMLCMTLTRLRTFKSVALSFEFSWWFLRYNKKHTGETVPRGTLPSGLFFHRTKDLSRDKELLFVTVVSVSSVYICTQV